MSSFSVTTWNVQPFLVANCRATVSLRRTFGLASRSEGFISTSRL